MGKNKERKVKESGELYTALAKDKLIFKENDITIINDDFITTEYIDENSIDLIVTSPPYMEVKSPI